MTEDAPVDVELTEGVQVTVDEDAFGSTHRTIEGDPLEVNVLDFLEE